MTYDLGTTLHFYRATRGNIPDSVQDLAEFCFDFLKSNQKKLLVQIGPRSYIRQRDVACECTQCFAERQSAMFHACSQYVWKQDSSVFTLGPSQSTKFTPKYPSKLSCDLMKWYAEVWKDLHTPWSNSATYISLMLLNYKLSDKIVRQTLDVNK